MTPTANVLARVPTRIPPAVAIAETMDRRATFATGLTLASGTLRMTAINLPAGQVITSITFFAASAVPASITDLWAAMYTKDRVLMAQSASITSWTESTSKTFTLVTPQRTTYAGLYYLGLNEVATTRNTLLSIAVTTSLNDLAPILSGTSTTGLTTTAPDPAAALGTGGTAVPYAYVS